MADVFISYSSPDEPLARFVYQHLQADGVTVFLAPVSLHPGEHWSPTVLASLRSSDWVVFLASRGACASPYVQQELGIAIGSNKKIVPVIWEIQPSELPGWASNYQSLDLRNKSIDQVRADITAIAARIKSNKLIGLAVVGGIIAALLKFG